MAEANSTLMIRVVSALLGGLILLGMGVYLGVQGLMLICTLAILLGVREFSRLAIRPGPMPDIVRHFYRFVCILLLIGLYLYGSALALAGACVAFFVGAIWLSRGRAANEDLLAALALGTFGMIYAVLFPYYAVRLVQIEHGPQWFLFLLLVVFFGDTFAYFCGRWFGNRKFMPLISPNKTWAGSIGGLLGSAMAGTTLVALRFPDVSLVQTVLFCLLCGAAAQSGDLLISLVKRVAQVKDTGRIMPGHGGILDRLDGIFIACPLVYAFALWVGPV